MTLEGVMSKLASLEVTSRPLSLVNRPISGVSPAGFSGGLIPVVLRHQAIVYKVICLYELSLIIVVPRQYFFTEPIPIF